MVSLSSRVALRPSALYGHPVTGLLRHKGQCLRFHSNCSKQAAGKACPHDGRGTSKTTRRDQGLAQNPLGNSFFCASACSCIPGRNHKADEVLIPLTVVEIQKAQAGISAPPSPLSHSPSLSTSKVICERRCIRGSILRDSVPRSRSQSHPKRDMFVTGASIIRLHDGQHNNLMQPDRNNNAMKD